MKKEEVKVSRLNSIFHKWHKKKDADHLAGWKESKELTIAHSETDGASITHTGPDNSEYVSSENSPPSYSLILLVNFSGCSRKSLDVDSSFLIF